MRHVRIGDAVLHVELRPARGRPTIVYINSLGSDFRIWDEVVEALQSEGFGALRYDFRGHGLSDLGAAPKLIDDHARDLAALMDAMGVARAPICGVSVGGAIALGLSRRFPEKVAQLILNNTGAKMGTVESWNARIAQVTNGGVAAIAEAVLQRWFSPADYAEGGGKVALCRNMLSRTPVAGYIATCVALRDSDMTEAAKAAAVPTLCVGGEFDGSTPPELVRKLASLAPGARYVEIPGAGHLPCVQRPDALAREILAFLG